MGKRSNGEGSVFRKKNGKWAAQVTYHQDGERKRKTRTSDTRADANSNLRKLHGEIERGFIGATSDTVGGYLLTWLKEVKQKHSTNTYHTYQATVCNHVIPIVGKKKLDKLTPLDVQNMINNLRSKGVGSRTIQMAYNYLNLAMRRAYKFRMIRENPCSPVEKPKHKPAKANPFTVEEAKLLLEHLEGHHLYSICFTALTTGMRPGELFGLFWSHVDLDTLEIHVQQQLSFTRGIKELKPPKTESSVRTISISEETAAVLADQRKHLVRSGFASSEFVFCGKRGISFGRTNFDKLWKDILQEAELQHRGFHQMRHTFATLAIANGVPITVVSETLGHSTTSLTLDIYAHVLPSMKSDATNAVSKLIG